MWGERNKHHCEDRICVKVIHTVVDFKHDDISVLVLLIAKNQEALYVRRVQTPVSTVLKAIHI